MSNKVDQLCHFITENGLQAPRLPHEKETALANILGTLGLKDASLASLRPTDCELEKPLDAPSDRSTCLPTLLQIADITGEKRSEGPRPDSFDGNEVGAESRTIYTSPPTTTHNEAFTIPSSETPQNLTGDSPRSILGSWDLDLGFRTCITPPPLDLQQFFGCSPGDGPSVEQEKVQIPLAAMISDDDSTFVEGSGCSRDIESLIDEVSDRVGALRIGPGGKTHFCGPTSTFNLTATLDSEDSDVRSAVEMRSTIETLSLRDPDHFGADAEIPPALEEHLINLYFSWQDPSFHIVDRKMYEVAKAKWQNMEETPFYSEALRFAMWEPKRSDERSEEIS